MEIKEGSQFTMLPPAPGKCQVCAAEAHGDEMPHNRDSLFYQFWFQAQHDRSPTWADAMLSCSDEVRRTWLTELRRCGVSEEKIGDMGLPEKD